MTESPSYALVRFGLAFLTALIFLAACAGDEENAQTPTPSLASEIEAEATIASCTFYLEVADTPQERARGLMGRESLDEYHGVLFVFEKQQTLNFWMRNTLIPLDILFIDENLTVVDVQTMRPEHEATSDSLPIHTSAKPALYAIEVNEGVAAQCGIEPGTPVHLREITHTPTISF